VSLGTPSSQIEQDSHGRIVALPPRSGAGLSDRPTHHLIENAMRESPRDRCFAPECNSSEFTLKSDVFAFGMILLQLIVRQRPFGGLNPDRNT
jgi:hypothetical protein